MGRSICFSCFKYYFFDVRVVAALQEREFRPGTPEFGEAFEAYLSHEFFSYVNYAPSEVFPVCVMGRGVSIILKGRFHPNFTVELGDQALKSADLTIKAPIPAELLGRKATQCVCRRRCHRNQ
jgi:hypothetical protein